MNPSYNYTAGSNNGKIASSTNVVSGEVVQYTNDSLKRQIKAQTTVRTSWGQGFVYDGFGNLYQKNQLAGSPPALSLTVNAATNQLTNTASLASVYDANGNLISGPNVHGASYDFLNRVTSAAQPGSEGSYSYDGSNRRIYKKTLASGTTTEGLDFFGARYFSGAQGRFTTPDWSAKPEAVPYATLDNPQSLNLYAYVQNNPLRVPDFDGHGDWSDRLKMAGQAAENFAIGFVKADAAAEAGVVGAPETGGASLALTFLGLWSASGNIVAGGVQLAGAATGETERAERGAQVAAAATSPSGLVTLVVTGDVGKAARAAAIEGVVLTDPKDLTKGTPAQKRSSRSTP